MAQSASLRPYLPLVLFLNLAAFVTLLNATMTGVFLPDIGDDLGVGSDALTWVVTGYITALAIGAPVIGRLADLLGVKKSFIITLAGFALMSLAVGLAPNFALLLLFRILQGFFATGMAGLAGATIVRTVPEAIRGKAFGLYFVALGLGFGLGPLVGAIGEDIAGWRAPFLATAAFSALLWPLTFRLLPSMPGLPGRRFDVPGGILMSGAIGTAFIAVAELPRDTTGLLGLVSLGLTGPLWIAFLWWIRRPDQPFVLPAVLRNVPYLAISAVSWALGGVLIGAIFLITILLTDLFETSTISVGLYLLPGALVMAFFAFVGGSLADAFGVRIVLVSSSAVLLGAVIILALVGVGWDPWAIAVIYIPIAAGYGAAVPSLPNTAARYLPPEHLATGIGVFNVFFFFGGPIAIALATVVLERREGATDALIPTYSGSAAIYADTLLVLVAMGIVGLLLALRFAPRKETQIVPTTGEESPSML